MSNYEHFRVRNENDVLIVELVDPKLFDVSVVMEWQDELLKLVDKELPNRAIIDFSRVEHCSTSVINGLLKAKRRISGKGGELKLCGMTETIRDAYRMLNLDGTVFQIYDTVDDALSAL